MTPSIDRAYEPFSEAAAPRRPLQVMANPTTPGNVEVNNSGSIAANDFLTLLIAEMKNQDPTANTDPNQYVNQLVQVNSLQQLISINETLQNALSTAPRSDGTGSKTDRIDASSNTLIAPPSGKATRTDAVSGNISTPVIMAASSRLSTALAGK